LLSRATEVVGIRLAIAEPIVDGVRRIDLVTGVGKRLQAKLVAAVMRRRGWRPHN